MRSIPDDNLSFPVFIRLGDGSTGSGFFLDKADCIYVVTAKHVLFDGAGNLKSDTATCSSLAPDHVTKQVVDLDLAACTVTAHGQADVVVIAFASLDAANRTIRFREGVTSKGPRTKIFGVGEASSFKFEDVLVTNTVYLFGYPTSLGQSGQLDVERPLIRRGIIADRDTNRGHIVVDCPVYQGNSGGLVLEVREVSLGEFRSGAIGVATQFVPFVEQFWSLQFPAIINTSLENSGLGIVTPIDRVLELI